MMPFFYHIKVFGFQHGFESFAFVASGNQCYQFKCPTFLFRVFSFPFNQQQQQQQQQKIAYVFIRMNIKSYWLFATSLAYKIISSFLSIRYHNTSVNHFAWNMQVFHSFRTIVSSLPGPGSHMCMHEFSFVCWKTSGCSILCPFRRVIHFDSGIHGDSFFSYPQP